MQWTPSWWEIHDKKAIENPGYVASMHPDKGGKGIVKLLWSVLARMSEIFEVGAGPGMNAICLAKMGHRVEAQDVSDYMWEILQVHTEENNVTIPLVICPAQDYIPEKVYDAFVCTTVLHFMPQEDAIKTIEMMQKYTRSGGYNALEMFASGTTYARSDRFYTTPEELKNLYTGWDVYGEETWSDTNAEDHEHVKFSLLLQKPL